jgi:hypothetical protein
VALYLEYVNEIQSRRKADESSDGESPQGACCTPVREEGLIGQYRAWGTVVILSCGSKGLY